MYRRMTIAFLAAELLDSFANALPPNPSPRNIPIERKTVTAPAWFSDIAPEDVSRKYVPSMRIEVQIIDPPLCATATIQKVPEDKTDRRDGTTFLIKTRNATLQKRIMVCSRVWGLKAPPLG